MGNLRNKRAKLEAEKIKKMIAENREAAVGGHRAFNDADLDLFETLSTSPESSVADEDSLLMNMRPARWAFLPPPSSQYSNGIHVLQTII